MRKEKLTQKQRIARLEKVSSKNYFDLIKLKKFMEELEGMMKQEDTSQIDLEDSIAEIEAEDSGKED